MDIRKYTSSGRPIDPNFKTNKLISILTVVVFVLFTVVELLRNSTVLLSLKTGILSALSVFFAWAVSRELDPDHDYSAFVAAGLVAVALIFLSAQPIIPLVWVMLVLRTVNHTTGLKMKITDGLVLLLITGWLVFQHHWIYGILTAITFFMDATMDKADKKQFVFSGLSIVFTIVTVMINYSAAALSVPALRTILIAASVVIFYIPFVIHSKNVKGVGDDTGELLSPQRVQGAQILAAIICFSLLFMDKQHVFSNIMVLSISIVSVAVYRYVVLVFGKPR